MKKLRNILSSSKQEQRTTKKIRKRTVGRAIRNLIRKRKSKTNQKEKSKRNRKRETNLRTKSKR